MRTERLKLTATFRATPKVLFEAWLSGAGHTDMTGEVASTTRGGRFTAWAGYITGQTIEKTPFTRFVQRWRTTDFAATDPDSRLEVTLTRVATGTRLTLIHTQIPSGQAAQYRQGWRDFYFTPIKAWLAS